MAPATLMADPINIIRVVVARYGPVERAARSLNPSEKTGISQRGITRSGNKRRLLEMGARKRHGQSIITDADPRYRGVWKLN